MDERGIIIADRDGEYRKQLAEYFEDAGYAVETTDSAVHVLCSILEKQTPVLLLGSDFDKKVCSADLIHLLKKCNRHLHIIMVSDEMSLPQARKIRQEGIFYHALKPTTPDDTREIGQAVECAFEKHRTTCQPEPPRPAEPPAATPAVKKADSGRWLWALSLAVVVLVTAGLSLVAVAQTARGNNTAMVFFLVFCALLIATQVLPVFRIRLPFGRAAAERMAGEALAFDEVNTSTKGGSKRERR